VGVRAYSFDGKGLTILMSPPSKWRGLREFALQAGLAKYQGTGEQRMCQNRKKWFAAVPGVAMQPFRTAVFIPVIGGGFRS